MKKIEYMSSNERMVGCIKELPDGKWSMYRGFVGGTMVYCGDFGSVHHAQYRMEKDGWEEIKK